ncbi:hypothetical protein LTR78_009362 [Recurvomyces mirabilis]|uniref:Uncharacterized protein n=1 Tax=Recurvomyces mirabilis TaxID=574656 RepID=A0AAE0TPJ5_9PEZI|nr:hypothetical protein LTR78_009362 [Recurvomyces mirabilis]
MPDRIDAFVGNDIQYLAYLEKEVTQLRQYIEQKDTTAHNIADRPQSAIAKSVGSQCMQPDGNVNSQTEHQEHLRSGIRFRLCDPSRYERKRRRPTPAQAPPWKNHADKLLQEVPKKSQWDEVMDSDGISEALRSDKAIRPSWSSLRVWLLSTTVFCPNLRFFRLYGLPLAKMGPKTIVSGSYEQPDI